MNTTNVPGHPGQLLRGIGFVGAALIILNSMIGAGIFALPAAVADNAGVLSPWLFLAGGLLITTVVLTYSELASYFRESGGPVLYTKTAFGPLAGFTAGWLPERVNSWRSCRSINRRCASVTSGCCCSMAARSVPFCAFRARTTCAPTFTRVGV
jgi:hypothetical protein